MDANTAVALGAVVAALQVLQTVILALVRKDVTIVKRSLPPSKMFDDSPQKQKE